MAGALKSGDRVRNQKAPALGIGKVVYADATLAAVYFKKPEEPIAEKRVAQFRLPAEFLEVVVNVSPDPEIDYLPPFVDGRFKRGKTSLTLRAAQDLFFKAYPLGFNDPLYSDPIKGEREYKFAAHRRYLSAMDSGLESLVSTPDKIRAVLSDVYHGPSPSAVSPLNLMHPRWEAPKFFEALSDESFAAGYLSSSLAFVAESSEKAFAALANLMADMPGLPPGGTGRWPYATWLPFIAAPARHIAFRPTFIREFADAVTQDIAFSGELSFEMYKRVLVLANRILAEVDVSGLNTARRPLDMIDAQSFMWVARRYFEPGFAAA